jgi:hypothetical protein
VLALAPVCFLVGFGVVWALAGGDDPESQAATAAQSTASPASTAADAPVEPTTTAPVTTAPATAPPPTATMPPGQTETGRRPAPPGAIRVDYGRWEGMFRLTDTSLVPSLQAATVGGQFTYLGGAGCPVRNVVVEGRFYDREDVPVGLANWESSWVTGEDGLAEDRPVPFGAYGSVLHLATAAELEVVQVVCSR